MTIKFGKFPPEYSSFNTYIIKEITNVLGEEIIGVYDDKNDVNKYEKYKIKEMNFIDLKIEKNCEKKITK